MKALLLAPMGAVHRLFNNANIEALRSLGYEVELAANFEQGDGSQIHNLKYVSECHSIGIKTHSIPFVRHSLFGNLKYLTQLKALLKEGKYDIIHTHTETGGLLLKLLAKEKKQSKFVYTPHGMSFWKGSPIKSQLIYKPIEKWICSSMDKNLGMNKEEMDVLNKWNKETAAYIHGIGLNIDRMTSPNRTREEIRNEFGVKENEKLIVSVGELNDNKNHSTVLKALSMIDHTGYKYVVCGVGPTKDILLKQAEDSGLKDKLILAGYRSDIPDVLNGADIFIFPSFHEGMPMSLLEAMACGLPVICSDIRGNVDVVLDDYNGYLFRPEDALTLSKKIKLLLDNDSKCKEMGNKNREIVKEFSLSSVTAELTEIYKRLEENHRNQPKSTNAQ